MFRIVHLETAVAERRQWGSAAAFDFVLTVDDSQLPGNNGPWHIAFDGSKAAIRPAAGDPAAMRAGTRLELDAPTLAELYAGELSPSAAQRLGLARIEGDTAALDAFFRPAASFRLLDEF
jgi:hypothetical protein